MKKLLCIILALVMLFSLAACSQKEPESGAENTGSTTDTEDPDKDVSPIYGQDPLAIIPGNYTSTDGKATAVVKLLGVEKVGVTVTIGDPQDYTEWSLTGDFGDDLTLSFTDDVMKKVKLDGNNVVVSEDTVYTDGSGTVVFDKNALKFTWEDKKSEQGAVVFAKE